MRHLAILEVTPRGWPDPGGVEAHVHNLSSAMAQCGNDVVVLTHDSTKSRGTAEGYAYAGNALRYRRFPLPKWGLGWLPSLRLLKDLRKRSHQARVIHLHHYHQPLAFLAAVTLTGINTPLVLTPHYHGTGHSRLARFLHRVWRPTAGRFLMSAVAHVIAVSEPEAELLVRHFPSLAGRITVIPNGITSPRVVSPHPVDASSNVIMSVGRLESYKRNDVVIRSAAKLGEQFLLVLVGEGPERPKLEQLARSLGIEHRVLFAGRIDDDSLAAWWARADVFVSMSEQEAFGIAVGEALAAGVPAVVSDIPAFRYVAGLANQCGAPPGAVTFTNEAGLSDVLNERPTRIPPVLVSRWEEVADRTIEVFLHVK